MHSVLNRAQTEGTPLVDGETATFVWRGKHPPVLIGDFTDWEDGTPPTFKRLARELWACSIRFPAEAYLEYTYVLGGERQPDPYNQRTTPNGIGKENHYFYMPAGGPTPFAHRDRSVPRGTVTRYIIQNRSREYVTGRQRTVHLYQPPVAELVPLVVVWDGVDYLRRARLPVILDNLIAQRHISPVAMAMVQNGGGARMLEYACSDTTLGFLVKSILPLARANLRLTDPLRGGYGVLGASMGGLMALYTGVRLPHIFNKVLTQSGAFSHDEYELVVYDLIRHAPITPIKIWMDVGAYDFGEIRTSNQAMAKLLQKNGHAVTFHQYNAGHNFPAWRDNVWRGLEALFGIPLESDPQPFK